MRTDQDTPTAFTAAPRQVLPQNAECAISAADVLLDVREAHEYAAGHLPGARLVPLRLLGFVLPATPELSSRDLKIVVYCKTSGRSSLAVRLLNELGYRNVTLLAGGYDAWLAAGKPVEK